MNEKEILIKTSGEHHNCKTFVNGEFWAYLEELFKLDIKEGWVDVDGIDDTPISINWQIIQFLREEDRLKPPTLWIWMDSMNGMTDLHMFRILADILFYDRNEIISDGTTMHVLGVPDVLQRVDPVYSNFGNMQVREREEKTGHKEKAEKRCNKKRFKEDLTDVSDEERHFFTEDTTDEEDEEDSDFTEDSTEDSDDDEGDAYKKDNVRYKIKKMHILRLSTTADEQVVFEGPHLRRLHKRIDEFHDVNTRSRVRMMSRPRASTGSRIRPNKLQVTGKPGVGKSLGSFLYFLLHGEQNIWIHNTRNTLITTIIVKFDDKLFVARDYNPRRLVILRHLTTAARCGLPVFLDGNPQVLRDMTEVLQSTKVIEVSTSCTTDTTQSDDDTFICCNWTYNHLLRALYYQRIVEQFINKCIELTSLPSANDIAKALGNKPLTNTMEKILAAEISRCQTHADGGDCTLVKTYRTHLHRLQRLMMKNDDEATFQKAMYLFTQFRGGELLIYLINRKYYVAGASPGFFFSHTEQDVERAINRGVSALAKKIPADVLFAQFREDKRYTGVISDFACLKMERIIQQNRTFFKDNAAVYTAIGSGKEASHHFEWFFYQYTKYEYINEKHSEILYDETSTDVFTLGVQRTGTCYWYRDGNDIQTALSRAKQEGWQTAWLWPTDAENAGFDCMFVNLKHSTVPTVTLFQVTASPEHPAVFNTLGDDILAIEYFFRANSYNPNRDRDGFGEAKIQFVMIGPYSTFEKITRRPIGNKDKIKVTKAHVPPSLRNRSFNGKDIFSEENILKYTPSIYIKLPLPESSIEAVCHPKESQQSDTNNAIDLPICTKIRI